MLTPSVWGDGGGGASGDASPAAHERIRCFARVRPVLAREREVGDEAAVFVRDTTVTIQNPTTSAPASYRMDLILGPECGQSDVFASIQPHVDAALRGYNTTVFAYGQTGTGKTHTMLGVDMWRLAEDAQARAAAAAPKTPGGRAASGAWVDDGSSAVASLMDYAGDFHPSWGIIPRTMAHLFRALAIAPDVVSGSAGGGGGAALALSPGERSERSPRRRAGRLPASVAVTVSYLEIYNEKVYDLLSPTQAAGKATLRGPGASGGLDIVQDASRGVFVPDAISVAVETEAEVLALLWEGARNRLLASTDMNEHSSRSHTIWQVSIERRHSRRVTPEGAADREGLGEREREREAAGGGGGGEGAAAGSDAETVVTRSKLNLVDLAGSEKIRTHRLDEMSERRVAELTSINQSLSTLGNCIRALSAPGRTHIPYRDSKLTRLLQDSLGGNCRTVFIVTLSPCASSLDETLSTLQFADRAKRVEIRAHRNETLDEASQVRRLESEVRRLRAALTAAKQSADLRGDGAHALALSLAPLDDADHHSPAAPADEMHQALIWREAAMRARAEADAERAARLDLLLTLASSTSSTSSSSSSSSSSRDAAVLREALERERSAAAAREARLQAAEAALAQRTAAMARFVESLTDRSHDAAGDKGGDRGGDKVGDKVRMLQLATEEMLRDLRRAKHALLDDATALQTQLEARTAQNAALAARLQQLQRQLQSSSSATPTAQSTTAASAATAAAAAAAAAASAAAEAREWSHHVDRKQRRSYWFHKPSGKTQWQRPAVLDGEADRERRLAESEHVEHFREQLLRLFRAVSHELSKQLQEIAAAAPAPSEDTARALAEETAKYQEETEAAMDREVTLLAALLALR